MNDGSFTVSGLAPSTVYTLNYAKDGITQTPITFTSIGTSYAVNGLTKGVYANIRLINQGCISNSISTTLTDPGAATILAGTPNHPSACGMSDGSITINGLVIGNTYSIKYKKDGIIQATMSYLATSSSYTITGLAAGAYTKITASNGGCVSNSLAQMLVDPGAATIALGTISQPTSCGANNGAIIITGLTAGLSYTLKYVKNSVQQTATTFTASGTSYTLSSLTAGNYSSINVTQGGCTSNSLDVILSNPGGAVIDVIANNVKTCSPGNDGSLLITGLSQGLTYTINYMKGGVGQTPITFSSTSTSYKINGISAGDYSNIVATQATCISNSDNATIEMPIQAIAPTLSASTLSNVCMATTADLNDITTSSPPAGTALTWHTAIPATAGNQVSNVNSVGAGTYYASFFNGSTNCFGATSPVTVTIIACSPNLTISKSGPTTATVSTNFTYTLTVTNTGNAPSTGGIIVQDNLPTGIAFLTGSGSGWSCSANAQLVTCTSTTPIAKGSSSIITLTVTPIASGSFSNTATVTGGGDPSTTAKNSNTVSTIVGGSVGLLSVKVFLQGPFNPNTGLMNDDLRAQSLIPLTQPYNNLSDFTYAGTESTPASVFNITGNNAIVDWVMVELHSPSSPSTIISRRAALVQRDGDIVDTDGVSAVTFSGLVGGNYYVAVRHRNHLGVMTATPVTISSTPALVNFTNSSTANYNVSSPYAQYTFTSGTSTGVRTMWAGNASGDSNVIFQGPDSDIAYVFNDIFFAPGNIAGDANFIRTNYLRTDFNLDGNTIYQGPNSDTDIVFFNVMFYYLGNSIQFPNAIIAQQIP